MKVYRIEHPGDNRGPFRSNFGFDDGSWSRRDTNTFIEAFDNIPIEEVPRPMGEITSMGKLDDWKKFVGHDPDNPDIEFGVAELDALNNWFPDTMRRIVAKYGFRLRCFEVPDDMVLPMRKQVAFKRHAARLVEEYELV